MTIGGHKIQDQNITLNQANAWKLIFSIVLQISRNQFFYGVNKRMGRFMMNGLLLTNGYPVINVPALKQNEFNQKMIKFYDSNNPNEMTSFMIECLDPKMILIMSE